MFGYVHVNKALLSEEDFRIFRAYYCGLCKQIGKNSQIARLGLSYDMTFLLTLLCAISEEEPKVESGKCLLHPLKKDIFVTEAKALEYVSDMSILLVLKKLEDDKLDEKSLKAFFGEKVYKKAAKKAVKRYFNKDAEIEKYLKSLSELEKTECEDSDKTADCFAKICELIFLPDYITDKNTRKILAWLGYNLGRWIYLIDALDDVKNDVKKNRYNPFKQRFLKDGWEKLCKDVEVTLTYTLANIAAAYDMLDVKRNDTILKNIIYSGLDGVQKRILDKQEEKDGSL